MKRSFLMISLLLLLSFAACTPDYYGILYSIEKEEKTVDLDAILPNTVTVDRLEKVGTTLWLSANILYKKTSGDTWAPVNLDAITGISRSNSRGIVLDTVAEPDVVYLLAGRLDNGNLKVLFSSTPDTASSWQEATFNTNQSGFPTGVTLQNLVPVYTQTGVLSKILVSGETPSTINSSLNQTVVYGVDAGSSDPEFAQFTFRNSSDSADLELANLVTSGAIGDSAYYLTTVSGVFKESTPLSNTFIDQSAILTTDLGSSAPHWPGHVLAVDSTQAGLRTTLAADFLLSDARNGRVFKYDGANWSVVNSTGVELFDKKAELGPISYYNDDGKDLFLVGSYNLGYFELALDGSTPVLKAPALTVDNAKYTSSDLSTARVVNFFLTDTKAFLGTTGRGLWSLGTDTWAQE